MAKTFNTEGYCAPDYNYMVDLTGRLAEIKAMVDAGKYFSINRGRQYGKTTTLIALEDYLEPYYKVISLDFQTLSSTCFENEASFVSSFSREILYAAGSLPMQVKSEMESYSQGYASEMTLSVLFRTLEKLCKESEKKIVLMIDEVDSASNNQVFLDFLAQLRAYYLKRRKTTTFQPVILAGVYDVREWGAAPCRIAQSAMARPTSAIFDYGQEIKRKIRPEEDHKANSPWSVPILAENRGRRPALPSPGGIPPSGWERRRRRTIMAGSPWNIAADYTVDMNFGAEEIAVMLMEYEKDYNTGMDVEAMAQSIYDYTSGYPYLVSRLCKLMDEKIAGEAAFPDKSMAWSEEGFQAALKMLLEEDSSLFESLMNEVYDYPELNLVISRMLFQEEKILYNPDDKVMKNAFVLGFLKVQDSAVQIANRIFETRLYNRFLLDRRRMLG